MRLNVRREQMDVMAAVAEANFERSIASHLRANYDDAVVKPSEGGEFLLRELPEETLEELIRAAIEKARRYGITRQSSIAGFAAMMFSGSPNFDRNRLCEVMLSDEEKSADDRSDEIPSVLSEKNWEAIRGDYDPSAWILPEEEAAETAEESKAEKTDEGGDPLARTVTGKTLARLSKKPKETIDVQPQVPTPGPDIDVNTVKINRES